MFEGLVSFIYVLLQSLLNFKMKIIIYLQINLQKPQNYLLTIIFAV